ncbi:MAG: hypothetical protein LBJ04_21635 [Sphingobacterium sp.]|nr:hypothetical protein [Sphingobacterium sp.]
MKKIYSAFSTGYVVGFVFLLFLSGCSKENVPTSDDTVARVKVVLGGIASTDIATLKANGSKSFLSENIAQKKNIELGKDLYLEATLTKTGDGEQQLISNTLSTKASTPKNKAAAVDLTTGVTYKVIVYDSQGAYVDEGDYTVGGASPKEFQLTAGKMYSFICYSLNGVSALPSTSTWQPALSDANLTINMPWPAASGNDDLLYTRIDKTVTAGMNVLDIIFQHKFSELSVKVDATEIGPIVNAELGFSELSNKFDLKLADGTMTYNGFATRNLTFPTLNNPVIQSHPMTVARPSFDTPAAFPGSVRIRKVYGFITIGSDQKYFEVPELAIEPGLRYQLNIVIKTTPAQIAGVVWAPGNLKYDGASYQFSYTNGFGSYFPFGNLYPYGDSRVFDSTPDNLGDPCNGIFGDGYAWRTPTKAEFDALAALGQAENKVIDGISGAWYPTNGTKGVFFPAAGYKDNQNSVSNPLWGATEGWYWSKSYDAPLADGSTGNLYLLHFGTTNGSNKRDVEVLQRPLNPAGTNDYARFRGAQIRCVRNL